MQLKVECVGTIISVCVFEAFLPVNSSFDKAKDICKKLYRLIRAVRAESVY
jgi:hypothetical protein